MKNMSVWVLVLVLGLVASAVWYEVQYRHSTAPEQAAPVKRASHKRDAPPPRPTGDRTPATNEYGQFAG